MCVFYHANIFIFLVILFSVSFLYCYTCKIYQMDCEKVYGLIYRNPVLTLQIRSCMHYALQLCTCKVFRWLSSVVEVIVKDSFEGLVNQWKTYFIAFITCFVSLIKISLFWVSSCYMFWFDYMPFCSDQQAHLEFYNQFQPLCFLALSMSDILFNLLGILSESLYWIHGNRLLWFYFSYLVDIVYQLNQSLDQVVQKSYTLLLWKKYKWHKSELAKCFFFLG